MFFEDFDLVVPHQSEFLKLFSVKIFNLQRLVHVFVNQISLNTLLSTFSNLLDVCQLFFGIIIVVMFRMNETIIVQMRSINDQTRIKIKNIFYLHQITHVIYVLLLLGFLDHLLLLVGYFIWILIILHHVWRWCLLDLATVVLMIFKVLFLDQFDIMFTCIFLRLHPDNFLVVFLFGIAL